jgi:hypothetical protein
MCEKMVILNELHTETAKKDLEEAAKV